jgi:hypothetical protein
LLLDKRMPVSGRKTRVRVWIFPNMQILEFSKLFAVTAVGRVHGRASHPLYRRAFVSSRERRLIRTAQFLRRLAASANAAYLAIDVRIFLIEDILRY